jgi:hypothetical protein
MKISDSFFAGAGSFNVDEPMFLIGSEPRLRRGTTLHSRALGAAIFFFFGRRRVSRMGDGSHEGVNS